MNRRRFLETIGGVTLATLGAACDRGTSADATTALARPELLVALGAERVRELGRRYREMVPAERDAASLGDAITRSFPWSARLFGSSSIDVPRLVHDDFDAGRTVVVLGWILSATEARQCALFSLLPA